MFDSFAVAFISKPSNAVGRLPKIDDKIETILMTLAQCQPLDGRVRWTLQLLADRLVALTRLESLSQGRQAALGFLADIFHGVSLVCSDPGPSGRSK